MAFLVKFLQRFGACRTSPPSSPAVADVGLVSPPVFDRALALKRCFGKVELLGEMVQCFFDEVDLLFPQMRAGLAKGDLVEVGRLGHRMKGTVVYLGAEAAKQAALRVEHFERHPGTTAEAEEAVNSLQRECAILRATLAADPTVAGR